MCEKNKQGGMPWRKNVSVTPALELVDRLPTDHSDYETASEMILTQGTKLIIYW